MLNLRRIRKADPKPNPRIKRLKAGRYIDEDGIEKIAHYVSKKGQVFKTPKEYKESDLYKKQYRYGLVYITLSIILISIICYHLVLWAPKIVKFLFP